jgi:hypothetical protein
VPKKCIELMIFLKFLGLPGKPWSLSSKKNPFLHLFSKKLYVTGFKKTGANFGF